MFALFEIANFALAVIAIIFSTIQFRDSKKQKAHMNDIAKSMSTRFVGVFPKNLNEITDLVAKAKGRLDIMIDICAYGHYSSPEDFRRYMAALEGPGVNRSVRMIVYDSNLAASDQEDSVFAGSDFFTHESQSKRYEEYFRTHPRITKRPDNIDEFKAILFKEQAMWTMHLSEHPSIELRTISEDLLLFAWLDDDEDAVFSFRSDRGERELSFRTRDRNLITTFRDLFDRTWAQAKPLENLPVASQIGASLAAGTS